jgi:hypothetical protein
MTEQQSRAYDYFQKTGFLPVDIESHPVFKAYDEADNRLLEITATMSTIWGYADNAIYKRIQGYLCSIWFFKNGAAQFCVQRPYGTPEGSLQQLVDTLYDSCIKAGLSCLQIWAIEERFLKEYLDLESYGITNEYSDEGSEYFYRTKDLLELSGKSNFYKRKRLKKFIDMPTVSFRPITKENIHVCREVEDGWCRQQDCESCSSFADTGCSKKSLELMIAVFDNCIYNGILGYIDDTPVGFAIWEKMNGKIAFVYFAKASVSDFTVYLYYIMAKNDLAGIEYVNNGHDMGSQGLRTFKKLLSDHEQLRKYICTFTKPEGEKGE